MRRHYRQPAPDDKSPAFHELIEPLIFLIQDRRVMLDADLARLYGVTTKALNQAVKRNSDRFPEDFAFKLTLQQAASLRSPGSEARRQAVDADLQITNRSQSVTGSQKHRNPHFLSWVFTEHGALMAANVLRSERAVQMSVFVIRAFVRIREQISADSAILRRLAEIDENLLRHDSALRDLYQKLLPLLQPPPAPPKRSIGFHA